MGRGVLHRLFLPLAVLSAFAAPPALAAPSLHERLIVLDTHLDTPTNFHLAGWDMLDRHSVAADASQVDYPRMVQGGLDGGFFVVYIPQEAVGPEGDAKARDAALLRAAEIHEMVAKHSAQFALAVKAEDAAAITKAGKRVVFMSMENGSPVAGDLSLMDTFYGLGVRMMGPVHMANNDLADSSTDPNGPRWGGLSPLGRAYVARANRLGVLLDASHASDQTLDQMLELSSAPIILSHSGARAIFNNPRNIDDARLRALATKGGVIQINAVSNYLFASPKIPEREAAYAQLMGEVDALGPKMTAAQRAGFVARRTAIDAKWPLERAKLSDFMRQLQHAIEVAGIDHVGISGDFDGGGGIEGLEDVADYPKITAALLAAGYDRKAIAKIWGGNALRVLAEADRLKAR